MSYTTLHPQYQAVVFAARRIDLAVLDQHRVVDPAQVQQLEPLDGVRGSPILPVFALVKSRFTTVFIRWPAFPCVSTGITDVPTGRF